MCGGRLTQLSIMEEVLIPDSSYNMEQIHSEVPKHLGRMWFPDMMPTWYGARVQGVSVMGSERTACICCH